MSLSPLPGHGFSLGCTVRWQPAGVLKHNLPVAPSVFTSFDPVSNASQYPASCGASSLVEKKNLASWPQCLATGTLYSGVPEFAAFSAGHGRWCTVRHWTRWKLLRIGTGQEFNSWPSTAPDGRTCSFTPRRKTHPASFPCHTHAGSHSGFY